LDLNVQKLHVYILKTSIHNYWWIVLNFFLYFSEIFVECKN
jgi:hypothetical protein